MDGVVIEETTRQDWIRLNQRDVEVTSRNFCLGGIDWIVYRIPISIVSSPRIVWTFCFIGDILRDKLVAVCGESDSSNVVISLWLLFSSRYR